ncbi:MAG: adenylate/guanylate cyclase domain-containing protein [Xanthobacteraceae bacterium]
MDARLERKLRLLAIFFAFGAVAGFVFNFAQGRLAPRSVLAGMSYGMLISTSLGFVQLFVLEGPMRVWLSGLSFATDLIVRSAVYATVIVIIHGLELGERIAELPLGMSSQIFWSSSVYSAVLSVVMNLGLAISNIIGPRALLNFVTGRYHSLVEEDRFVLFVDIAGSTGLAERLGGVVIHRFLDRTFRLLTVAVEDYRGEVLSYVGDEVIVTWRERSGVVDCRPLRCFVAMRDELAGASSQFEREFGAVPRIRGSLHFGPVIIGEIGDVKRAIVFNGDVMNTAARLEELSRTVDGGFLASRAAMQRFGSMPPFAVRDLGRLPIRGRADGIDVVGIDAPAAA